MNKREPLLIYLSGIDCPVLSDQMTLSLCIRQYIGGHDDKGEEMYVSNLTMHYQTTHMKTR